jgi:hypothetical protein
MDIRHPTSLFFQPATMSLAALYLSWFFYFGSKEENKFNWDGFTITAQFRQDMIGSLLKCYLQSIMCFYKSRFCMKRCIINGNSFINLCSLIMMSDFIHELLSNLNDKIDNWEDRFVAPQSGG